jgi:hypothetical protein
MTTRTDFKVLGESAVGPKPPNTPHLTLPAIGEQRSRWGQQWDARVRPAGGIRASVQGRLGGIHFKLINRMGFAA